MFKIYFQNPKIFFERVVANPMVVLLLTSTCLLLEIASATSTIICKRVLQFHRTTGNEKVTVTMMAVNGTTLGNAKTYP